MKDRCELCASQEALVEYTIELSDMVVTLCSACNEQITSGELDENHFNCLNDSMWSEEASVKILSYILLNKLGRQDMVDMMYLEEDEQKLADQVISAEANKLTYKDANGVELKAGDTVVITKDLDVKGTGFTAKRGTAVRNIALVPGDDKHIEGRVNGVKIHILTQYLKKS